MSIGSLRSFVLCAFSTLVSGVWRPLSGPIAYSKPNAHSVFRSVSNAKLIEIRQSLGWWWCSVQYFWSWWKEPLMLVGSVWCGKRRPKVDGLNFQSELSIRVTWIMSKVNFNGFALSVWLSIWAHGIPFMQWSSEDLLSGWRAMQLVSIWFNDTWPFPHSKMLNGELTWFEFVFYWLNWCFSWELAPFGCLSLEQWHWEYLVHIADS